MSAGRRCVRDLRGALRFFMGKALAVECVEDGMGGKFVRECSPIRVAGIDELMDAIPTRLIMRRHVNAVGRLRAGFQMQ